MRHSRSRFFHRKGDRAWPPERETGCQVCQLFLWEPQLHSDTINQKHQLGPSVFSGATGTPSSSQRESVVVRDLEQASEFDGP